MPESICVTSCALKHKNILPARRTLSIALRSRTDGSTLDLLIQLCHLAAKSNAAVGSQIFGKLGKNAAQIVRRGIEYHRSALTAQKRKTLVKLLFLFRQKALKAEIARIKA